MCVREREGERRQTIGVVVENGLTFLNVYHMHTTRRRQMSHTHVSPLFLSFGYDCHKNLRHLCIHHPSHDHLRHHTENDLHWSSCYHHRHSHYHRLIVIIVTALSSSLSSNAHTDTVATHARSAQRAHTRGTRNIHPRRPETTN